MKTKYFMFCECFHLPYCVCVDTETFIKFFTNRKSQLSTCLLSNLLPNTKFVLTDNTEWTLQNCV